LKDKSGYIISVTSEAPTALCYMPFAPSIFVPVTTGSFTALMNVYQIKSCMIMKW